MSFLLRQAAAPLRTVRVAAPSTAARLSTSIKVQKSAVDSAKDVLKKVDRTASDAAVKGIETGGTSSMLTSLHDTTSSQ